MGIIKGEVAILGAGILGSSIALYLAQKNINVRLFDGEERPFSRASRWNEGKIHLGYLYSADPSLSTAKKLIPAGLSFPGLIKELIGRPIPEEIITQKDDYYLIHRNSVVDANQYDHYSKNVSLLIQEHPGAKDYFIPLDKRHPRRLESRELRDRYNTDFITAAFQVPERSIRTSALADYFEATLMDNQSINLMMKHTVTSVQPEFKNQSWSVSTINADGVCIYKGFKVIINALWEGRPHIDQTMGGIVPDRMTHRYRVSVFAKTKRAVNVDSAVIAVGPFGDVKNYDGKHLYLSWYDAGLLAEGHDVNPPEVMLPNPDRQASIMDETLKKLTQYIPGLDCLNNNLEMSDVKGGWVFAEGRGPLDDPRSELHRRDQMSLIEKNGYFSIDTGKFSLAPWLARDLSKVISRYLSLV